ncbi:MAG: CoA-transferase [Gammaproteobacteria bacterium]
MSARQQRLLDERAAATWLEDGMTIALGEPAPMAMVRQMIARGLRDLTVVAGGLAIDMLVAAGCVKKTISYYAGGGTAVPVAPSFRYAAERGEITVWECEEGILTSGLEAAAKGLPFLPWRGGVGTSLAELNPELKVFSDPIAGQILLAVPAIEPDIAIVHAAAADAYGNVQHCGGPGWIDLFLCRAARRTIVQVEKIISNEAVRADPWATTIAGADAVVCLPWGAHPFYSRGYYLQDIPFVEDYVACAAHAARTGERSALDGFLDRYCREPASHAAYLERIGLERLLALHEY